VPSPKTSKTLTRVRLFGERQCPMSRPNRVFLVICLFIVAAGALLVSVEATLRHRNRKRTGLAAGTLVRYYHHARLQKALVRDADYNGVIHINRYGFRGADFDSVKADGVTRIMVVGASTTFDRCALKDSEMWTVRLEESLQRLLPGKRFEVINAGVPGIDMRNQVIRLQTELYAFAPDVYLVYANHGIPAVTDAGVQPHELRSHTPNAIRAVAPWDVWLRGHSQLYDRMRPQWKGDGGSELNAEQWQRAAGNSARDFHHDLTSFVAIAQSLGARVVLAEINRVTGTRAFDQLASNERAAFGDYFSVPPEVIFAGYQRYRGVWEDVARRTDVPFIPTDSLQLTGEKYYCTPDPIHFNTAGAQAMGQRMAELLLPHLLQSTKRPAESQTRP
jgi:hypothetical protein